MSNLINLSACTNFTIFEEQLNKAQIHAGFLGGRKLGGHSMNAIVKKYIQLRPDDLQPFSEPASVLRKIHLFEEQPFQLIGLFHRIMYPIVRYLGNLFAKYAYPKDGIGKRFDRHTILQRDIDIIESGEKEFFQRLIENQKISTPQFQTIEIGTNKEEEWIKNFRLKYSKKPDDMHDILRSFRTKLPKDPPLLPLTDPFPYPPRGGGYIAVEPTPRYWGSCRPPE